MSAVDYSSNGAPDDYRCSACGVHGVKLWRQYQSFHIELLCAPCACKDQKVEDTVGDDGRRPTEHGRDISIAWLVPAVPTEDNETYWGFTSVPTPGIEWWQRLPTRRTPKEP